MGKRNRKISSQSEGWQARDAATIFSNFIFVGAALRGRPILRAPSTFEDYGSVTNGVATECHPTNVLASIQPASAEDKDSKDDCNQR
jgi:hypothetical protein